MTETRRKAIEKAFVNPFASCGDVSAYKEERNLLRSKERNSLDEHYYLGGESIISDFAYKISSLMAELKDARAEANVVFKRYMLQKKYYDHSRPLDRVQLVHQKQKWLEASKNVRKYKMLLAQAQTKAAKFQQWYDATNEYIKQLEANQK